MNKGLEAVEELYEERAYTYAVSVNQKSSKWANDIKHYDHIGDCLITIETELKRLEVLDTVVNEPLEALKRLNEFRFEYEDYEMCETDDYMIVENALKQFEIKTKKQDKILRIIKEMMEEDTIYDLQRILNKYSNWEDYDSACDYRDENPIIKAQEEFDLLKEVLK